MNDQSVDQAVAEVHQLQVAPEEARERLDRLLSRRLATLSRMRIKALILGGHVAVAGRTVIDASYRVKPGEALEVAVPAPAPAEPAAQAMELRVVYEDADLIVIDKPAGLVVHPAPGNPDRTLVNALLAHCGESLAGIGGVRRPGIVHRLDKDTSGLLVAAKSQAAHEGLVALFQAHDIEREYVALVWGVPRPRQGRIEAAIGRDPRNRKKMAVVAKGRGKPAVTNYRVVEAFGEAAALVRCRLETGRTHQIRVHMAELGHPVMGDPLYGRARRGRRQALPAEARAALEALGRQALHAAVLGFVHPVSGKALFFESPLPDDVMCLVRALAAPRWQKPSE